MQLLCNDISKVYIEPSANIRTLVLRGIDLDISSDSEEFIALYGTSGCGKTTLLEILTLGKQVTAGVFTINEINVEQISASEKLSYFLGMGYLKQELNKNVFPLLSVFQNLSLSPVIKKLSKSERQNRIHRYLSELNLIHRENFPASRLSGGELQRLGIGMALIAQPKILFLDEPFSDQDFFHTKKIIDFLITLQKENLLSTIVISSHNPFPLSFVNRVLHLEKGKISEESSRKETFLPLESFDVSKVGNRLYLPQNNVSMFPRLVNLASFSFDENKIILDLDITMRDSQNICYINPIGVILIPNQLLASFKSDLYKAHFSDVGKKIILEA